MAPHSRGGKHISKAFIVDILGNNPYCTITKQWSMQCCYFGRVFCRVNTRDLDDIETPATKDTTAGDWLPLGLTISEAGVEGDAGSETLEAALTPLADLWQMAADGGLAGT